MVKRPNAASGALGTAPELVEVGCVVCRKRFQTTPRLAVRAKTCTTKAQVHEVVYRKMPDGQTKKVGCKCCLCIYKKTLAKHRTLDGKLIPRARVQELLQKARDLYGDEVGLAFRVGLNAMLRVKEIAKLRTLDFLPDAKPLPRMTVIGLKKQVEMTWPIDIDSSTAEELKKHVRKHPGELLFGIPVRTLQHKFKQVARSMNLGHLSIHSLRHTGVSNRAKNCKTMDELNYVRIQARHESLETTLIYMGYEEQQRLDMSRRTEWF